MKSFRTTSQAPVWEKGWWFKVWIGCSCFVKTKI